MYIATRRARLEAREAGFLVYDIEESMFFLWLLTYSMICLSILEALGSWSHA